MDNAVGKRKNNYWIILAILVHVVFGGGMAPLRYAQTVAGLPTLGTVAIGDLIAFAIMVGFTVPRVKKEFWRSKTLWLMVFIVVTRTVFWTLSGRYTQTYLAQMVNLLAPFFVVIFDRFVNKTKLPRFTLLAITISIVGGFLLIFGGLQNQPMVGLLTRSDWIGLGMALLATFGIAAYMVIVKYGQRIGLPFEAVFISQVGAVGVVVLILSLILGENWSAFLQVNWKSISVILFYAIVMEIGGKMGLIAVIGKLGAPLVSSMLAVRLVAAIFAGWLILGEKPESLLQWIGAGIVVITITWYLSQQDERKD